MTSGRWVGAALTLLLLAPAGARAQTSAGAAVDGRWHLILAPDIWAAGMEGTAGLKGAVEVPVDESFGDTLETLDFGFLGRFEGRKDRVGFVADLAYMNLGAGVTRPVSGQTGLGADLRTLTAEGLLTYRVAHDEAKGRFVDRLR